MITPRTVSVLGLGLMGAALAESLLAAGHRVTVWNRSGTKASPLVGKGAALAESVAEAIAASDVTIVCVTDHAATMALLDGCPGPAAPRTLIQLSTMTPEESRELESWAHARKIAYLDGSILGLPSTVFAGDATVIYSGPREPFETHAELLSALGAAQHLSPEIGAAARFDRVWYAYVYGNAMAFLQGAAMARALGFSLGVYFDTVRARTPVMIEQCLKIGGRISAGDYKTADARIGIWADAFRETLSICREKGVDDSLPSAVLGNLDRAIAAGHGDSDLGAVFEILIRECGPARRSAAPA